MVHIGKPFLLLIPVRATEGQSLKPGFLPDECDVLFYDVRFDGPNVGSSLSPSLDGLLQDQVALNAEALTMCLLRPELGDKHLILLQLSEQNF